MRLWITLSSFVVVSGLFVAVLAWLGLPYDSLSSLSSRNPYVEDREVFGKALLQARGADNNSGTEVTLSSGEIEESDTTNEEGSFSFLEVAPGTYDINGVQPGWLLFDEPVVVEDGKEPLDIGSFVLAAGDADADEDVDTDDLVLFQESLDQLPPPDTFTDPNDDEVYDIFDMALGGLNFGKSSS